MPTNDFKPFATASDANVLSLSEYDALAALTSGFASGVANSAQVNRVWRQSSLIASMIAQFICDQANTDALDDGTIATLEADFLQAVKNIILAYNYITAASPALTGTPTAPTPTAGDNSTKIATTAFVDAALTPYAPLNSPTLTGTPQAANTPAANDNSGKLATTAFVQRAITAGTSYDAAFKDVVLSGLDTASNAGQLRMTNGAYGVIFRNDGSSFYLLLTPSGSPNGTFNALRPISINLATGAVSIDGSGAGADFGGSVTAPNPPVNDNSTRLVNSNWVLTKLASYASVAYVNGTFETLADMAASFANSPGSYFKTKGAMVQYGVVVTGTSQPNVVNFPVAFPNAVGVIVGIDQGSPSTGTSSVHTVTCQQILGNLGQFKVWGIDFNGAQQVTNVAYIAIGW